MLPHADSFVLSRNAVRELDRRAIQEFGIPGLVLMENAGRGAAEILMQLNPDRLPIVALCGPGNNGGDGLVMARHLDYHGYQVEVRMFAPEAPPEMGIVRTEYTPCLSPDATVNYRAWRKYRRVVGCSPDTWEHQKSSLIDTLMNRQCWIVDALFGTGLIRPLESHYAELVGIVNASGNPVLAVDLPSGLDGDTGQPLGATIRATHTVTFVAPKRGFRSPTAWPWLGEVHVVSIGAPKDLVDEYRRNSR